MANSARFWNLIAKRYARTPVADEAAYQEKLRITREYLRPDMEVVELGCGTGSTAIAHAPFVKQILATDISARMLEIARQKIDTAGVTNVRLEQGDVETLGIADDSADMVLALSLIHLVDNRDVLIRQMIRMLKPGGLLVTSTACIADKLAFMRYLLPLGRAVGLLPLVRVFSRQDLEQSMVDSGLEPEHQWRPEKAMAVFIIARKPDRSDADKRPEISAVTSG